MFESDRYFQSILIFQNLTYKIELMVMKYSIFNAKRSRLHNNSSPVLAATCCLLCVHIFYRVHHSASLHSQTCYYYMPYSYSSIRDSSYILRQRFLVRVFDGGHSHILSACDFFRRPLESVNVLSQRANMRQGDVNKCG